MEFDIYTIPFSTYPRVKYAYKHLKQLLCRFNELNKEHPIKKLRHHSIYCRDIDTEEFQLCAQSFDGQKGIDVQSLTKQNDIPICSKERFSNVKELVLNRSQKNSFVIIVAFDINEEEIPDNDNVTYMRVLTEENGRVYSADCQNVTNRIQHVHKEQIYDTIIKVMELNLFQASGMRRKCDYLLNILDVLYNTRKDQQLDCKDENGISSKGSGRTAPVNLKRKLDGTEEDISTQLSQEQIQRIERLSDEMIGMFNRSSLPKCEMPQESKRIVRLISDQLKEELKQLNSSIRSCGYRGGTLFIFVDDDYHQETLEPCLRTLLRKHGIKSFSIEPWKIQEYCKVGTQIDAAFGNDKSGRSGTLGGFGNANSSVSKESKTIGLVSRHVVCIGDYSASTVRINCEGKITEASVDIDISFAKKQDNVLDIAAISFKKDKSEFDMRYKTSENERAEGILTSYTTEQLKGLPVHISGAGTPLGHGVVTMPKIQRIREKCMDENFIFVEDNISVQTKGNNFCKELDSGAIVCEYDQDNQDKVQLISMVIGRDIEKKGLYATLKLKEGIEQVEKETKSTIELL